VNAPFTADAEACTEPDRLTTGIGERGHETLL
jgi:hypothetical protein